MLFTASPEWHQTLGSHLRGLQKQHHWREVRQVSGRTFPCEKRRKDASGCLPQVSQQAKK